MNVLVVAGFVGSNAKGGASRSITNIVNVLKSTKNVQIKVLTQKVQNKLLRSISLDSYLSIPSIIKEIVKFNPNIIITQSGIAFPVILVSKIMKIPVIHVIRSTVDFCPKFVDVIGYGKACSGINNRKQCFKCIERWRTLRILIGNRAKGTEYSIRTSLVSVLYKIRYFVCSFNLYLTKKANINLVASDLMKRYFSNKISRNKFKVINITPILKGINRIVRKRKQIIFIRTDFETSHKGLDFIKRISKSIPKDYYILMIGGKNIEKGGYSGIVDVRRIFSKKLFNELLSESLVTLVPSFCTEAFGRVIPESLVNKTPVISSSQCGANQFFKDKVFLKVVPFKLDLWIRAIEVLITNPLVITDNDVSQVYEQFSLGKSKSDFIKMIKEVLV